MPSSPLLPYSPPLSQRAPETLAHRWLLSPLGFAILYLILPALFGVMFIALSNLVVSVISLQGPWTGPALAMVFYFFAVIIAFSVGATSEAAREFLRGVDHGMRRTLSIVVVGLSDLLFRGSTVAAMAIYTVFVGALFALGFKVATAMLDAGSVASFLALASGTGAWQAAGVDELLKAGLSVVYAPFLVVLPVLAFCVPSWRLMTQRPGCVPLDERALAAGKEGKRTLLVAHITDLHVADHAAQTETATQEALQAADRLGAHILALTGDLTDKGSPQAWARFLALPLVSERDQRLVILPGNHDLNTWHPSVRHSLWTFESLRHTESHRRAYLYLQACAQVMGDRTWVICPLTGAVRKLSAVFLQAGPALAAWDTNAEVSTRIRPSDFLQSLFPMVVETRAQDAPTGVVCVVWNTVKSNRWAPLNSIGELGMDQVKRAEQLLAMPVCAESPLLHMMHHQLAVPNAPVRSQQWSSRFDRMHTLGMGLESAQHFLEFIRSRLQRTCVLHGHHHKYFVCREPKSGMTIVSAPSAKFGTEVSFSDHVVAGPRTKWLGLSFAVDGVHLDLSQVQPMP